MKGRVFGEIPGINEGQEFDSRIELALSLVHKPRQAGLSGSQNEGADSIVLSGGYEDDEDHGDIIVYSGFGGRDLNSGKQVTDQELVKQNLALAENCKQGLPVRVIRGTNHKSEYSPNHGYRYDGLYRVEEYWREKGKQGFYVWRFKLIKISRELKENYVLQSEVNESKKDYKPAQRIQTNIQRIIRNTELSIIIKEIYKFKCQVCGIAIQTNSGLYAEAAHIKPLGTPHNGPDSLDNILCLCPNHHVKFDFGGFAILDNFELIGESGFLTVNSNHKLNKEFIIYHREHFYDDK